jgi:hypothetical protein
MDTGFAILAGLIVGACIVGGIIYAGLQLIANELKKQK